MKIFNHDRAILLLPKMRTKILRLNELQQNAQPKVAFVGKFNHGKSMLANAITGSHFKVADKRETMQIATHYAQNIEWIDTPGIDADTTRDDDKISIEAVTCKADIIYFIHAVTVGELDKVEIDYLQKLDALGRKVIIVLSQIDNVTNRLDQVFEKIENQVMQVNGELKTHKVSAMREMHNEPLIQEKSGLKALLELTLHYISSLKEDREHEVNTLIHSINSAVLLKKENLLQAQSIAKSAIQEIERSLSM